MSHDPPKFPEATGAGNVKVILGSGAAIFLLGAIFWAGAAYNRLDGMEHQLTSISATLGTVSNRVGDIDSLKVQQVENERRIGKLEDQLRQLR